ncbi:MAG: EAL domain-containing protein [Alphaproteobacteria bacterium]|nr:MAG: EAL domain-containing protein [Alphaproteobacteria bacterium]
MAHSDDGSIVRNISEARGSRERKRDPKAYAFRQLFEIIDAQSEIARAGLDLKGVVDIVTRRAQSLTNSTGAVLEMVEDSDLVFWSGSGSFQEHEGVRSPLSGCLSGLCISEGTVLRCHDSESDDRVNKQACRKIGLRSALVAPLECEGELIGTLKVASDQPNAYTDHHVELLHTLAAFAGSVLNSALTHARLTESIEQGSLDNQSHRSSVQDDRSRLLGLIAENCISPVFQPIVELASGRVVGFEALSRFNAVEQLGVDEWFAMATRAGMCLELEAACIAAAVEALGSTDTVPGYISLNVSPLTLREYDFESLPKREGGWVLELTEHTEVHDYTELTARVKELQSKGIRIAIDDVGAGFSSLRHILRLSPDIVKLDLSITRDIDTVRRNQLLASAIISFSRDSGMYLVAEGVETGDERDTLARLGVIYGQGYLFGKPAPIEC